ECRQRLCLPHTPAVLNPWLQFLPWLFVRLAGPACTAAAPCAGSLRLSLWLSPALPDLWPPSSRGTTHPSTGAQKNRSIAGGDASCPPPARLHATSYHWL